MRYQGTTFISCLVPALLALATSATSWAGPVAPGCEVFAEWLNAPAESEYDLRLHAAQTVFDSYLAGKIEPAQLSGCLQDSIEREKFMTTLSRVVFLDSLQKLRRSGAYLEQSEARYMSHGGSVDGLPLFEAHIDRADSDADLKAGFNRGEKSLFARLDRIPGQEWFFIFSHELVHRMDPVLAGAITEFNAESLERVALLAKTSRNSKDLPRADRRLLRKVLMAGLNRGLLAEYRAWYYVFDGYEPGIRAGLWPRIQWVERILSRRNRGESLSHFVFRYLDPQFTDPDDGIYSLDLVRGELQAIRAELRSKKSGPSMGSLPNAIFMSYLNLR
jgi:hypothetical protein